MPPSESGLRPAVPVTGAMRGVCNVERTGRASGDWRHPAPELEPGVRAP